jgi:hypothetical protein
MFGLQQPRHTSTLPIAAGQPALNERPLTPLAIREAVRLLTANVRHSGASVVPSRSGRSFIRDDLDVIAPIQSSHLSGSASALQPHPSGRMIAGPLLAAHLSIDPSRLQACRRWAVEVQMIQP